ncbi:conjugal transfer protein [Listeria monocytogenes]|nr:conjugal transfer protein [Listeria monocytogenes]EAE8309313.1 conjugal transfer protein [Listeria monocytogenes]EAF9641516.1 conjugal transfer protein [Listeria monocytogenes]ECB9649984.1 conjugal transfer protein [Listeria monocytogenes]ECB9706004.1 conjugal transfer protein [Listeria monocytogenes]
MKDKQVLDYREPFNAPYMIREIAKNVRLPFIVYAQDFTIAILSFFIVFLLLFITIGFNQITAILSVGIPYGIVQIFNRIEPDGKRLDLFTKDYLTYLWFYVLPKKIVYHGRLESIKPSKVVYEKQTINSIRVLPNMPK